MRIQLLAYGIARDILRTRTIEFVLEDGNTISTLKRALVLSYPEFETLRSLQFAVNETYVDDTFVLNTDDEVVIIPPVSGG
jgi:molybdopterin converting factor small subunit